MARRDDDELAREASRSRSRTMCEAVRRLGTLDDVARRSSDGRRALHVLVLGADRREGTTPEDVARSFGGLATMAKEGGVEEVSVVCVGPNVRVDEGVELGRAVTAEEATAKRAAVTVEFRCGLHHECASSDDVDERANVAFAFNAGVWGYDPEDWLPTIERVVVRDGTPLVVTSYSLREAESDEDSIRESFSEFENVSWVWEAEINENSSAPVRELLFDRSAYMDGGGEELRENLALQCVALVN